MTAPVVGSGSCPACTQRVEKPSWFGLVIRCDPEVVDEVEAGRDAEELIAVHDDGDVVLAEQRHQVGDRRIGGDGLEPRHHHLLDRPRERLVGVLRFGQQRGEHVALVDQADDMPALVDHRELRDVGRAHAGEYGAQIVLRPHHDGGAFAVAADHDVAHGAVPVRMGPAFLRQEGRIEHLGEILGAGIADQAHDALAASLCARQ